MAIRWRWPPGKLRPMLATRQIVAELEAHDEIMGVGRPGGGDDLVLARAGPPQSNVVADRTLEQEIILRDIGDLPPQRREADSRDVHAVAQDLPRSHFVETQDEVHNRRFTAARAADKRRRPARFGDEVDVMQDGFAGSIAESHITKLDSARGDLEVARAQLIFLVIIFVKEARTGCRRRTGSVTRRRAAEPSASSARRA